MEREPIKIDICTAEVWQAAQQRRASDFSALRAVYFPMRRVNEGSPGNALTARRLAIPTMFASLLIGVAVWTVAGHPNHPVRMLAAVHHSTAP